MAKRRRSRGLGNGGVLRPLTRIKISATCPVAPLRGRTGYVEKYVSFDRYYVQIRGKGGGRFFVHSDCVKRRR